MVGQNTVESLVYAWYNMEYKMHDLGYAVMGSLFKEIEWKISMITNGFYSKFYNLKYQFFHISYSYQI